VPRRFPSPWSINEHQELFNVKDAMRSCAAASNRSLQRLSFQCSRAGRLVGMRRKSWIVGALAAALSIGATDTVLAGFAGPGPWITGNDTGGIIPYSPDLEGVYQQMAQDYCARWRRLSHITSVHRVYGDYISFVCIDKPWMIH
jgi:hypothetical protein